MEPVKNKSFSRGDVVILDGKSFDGCSFSECTLVYNGGTTQWSNCKFNSCRILLGEAASRTEQVLKGFGFRIIPPQGGFEIVSSTTIH